MMDRLGEGQPLDIVLAEDNPDLAQLNQLVLESAGHNVEITSDGASTLAAVQNNDPDLLILDIQMPHGDGLDVLEELRAAPATAEQPVMVMSNTDLTAGEERRLVRLGVIDLLAKWKAEPKLLVGWVRGWAAGRISRVPGTRKRS